MIFTKEQIDEIRQQLIIAGVKDTDFDLADLTVTPLTGNETVVIVKDGKNRQMRIIDLHAELNNSTGDGATGDFFNMSAYLARIEGTEGIYPTSLEEAVLRSPWYIKKIGQIITFYDSATGKWLTYQHKNIISDDWLPENFELFNSYSSSIIDISERFPAGGDTGGDVYSLEMAIETVPLDERKGGIRIRFKDALTGEYVEYRLMSNEWSDDPMAWQGVDDYPVPDSENLIKSKGVYQIKNDVDDLKECCEDVHEIINTIINNTTEPPAYVSPAFEINLSNVYVEYGADITETIESFWYRNDAGPATYKNIAGAEPGAAYVDEEEYEVTMSWRGIETRTVHTETCTVRYQEGPIKNDNYGNPYPEGRIPAGEIVLTFNIIPYKCIYQGAVVSSFVPSDSTKVELTKLNDIELSNFVLDTGSSLNDFVVLIPSERTITRVLDTNTNADVTSEFTLVDSALELMDGASDPAATITYKYYRMVMDVPFSENHKLRIYLN